VTNRFHLASCSLPPPLKERNHINVPWSFDNCSRVRTCPSRPRGLIKLSSKSEGLKPLVSYYSAPSIQVARPSCSPIRQDDGGIAPASRPAAQPRSVWRSHLAHHLVRILSRVYFPQIRPPPIYASILRCRPMSLAISPPCTVSTRSHQLDYPVNPAVCCHHPLGIFALNTHPSHR